MKRLVPVVLIVVAAAAHAGALPAGTLPAATVVPNTAQLAWEVGDTMRYNFLRGSIPADASHGLRELSYDTLVGPYAVDMLYTNGNQPKRWLGQWDRGEPAEHRDIVYTQLANQSDADTLFGGGWRFRSPDFGWGGLVAYRDQTEEHATDGLTTFEQDQSTLGLYGVLAWKLGDTWSIGTSLYYQDLSDTLDDSSGVNDSDATDYRATVSARYQPGDTAYYDFWLGANLGDADAFSDLFGPTQRIDTGRDSFGAGFRGVFAGDKRDLELGAAYVYDGVDLDNDVFQSAFGDEARFIGDDIHGSKATAYARYQCHESDNLDMFGGLRITGEQIRSRVDTQLFLGGSTRDLRELSRFDHDILTLALPVAAVVHVKNWQLTLGAEYVWTQDEQEMLDSTEDAGGSPLGSTREKWDATDSETNFSAALSWLPNDKIRLDAGWAQDPVDRGIGGRPADDLGQVSFGAWFFF